MSATHTFTAPCHMPCPDMSCYSLNAEQKAKGLAGLQKARAYVREVQLKQLRQKHQELTAEANHEGTSLQRKLRIAEELKKLSNQARNIQERWS